MPYRQPGAISSYSSTSLSNVHFDENSRHRLVGTPLILFEPKNLFCSYKEGKPGVKSDDSYPQKCTVGFGLPTSEGWQLSHSGRVCPWSVCAASASTEHNLCPVKCSSIKGFHPPPFQVQMNRPAKKPPDLHSLTLWCRSLCARQRRLVLDRGIKTANESWMTYIR